MSSDPSAVELRAGDSVRIDPAEWEARAAAMYRAIEDDPEVPREAVAEALRELRLGDAQGVPWIYDGSAWIAWDGQAWRPGRPAGLLWLLPFTMTLVPPVDERPPLGIPPLEETVDDVLPDDPTTPPDEDEDDDDDVLPRAASLPPPTARVVPTAVAAQPAYRSSHSVPPTGLPVWSTPDAAAAPVAELSAGLDVMVVEQHPNGWTRVLCSNGWSGWIDGRRLVAR